MSDVPLQTREVGGMVGAMPNEYPDSHPACRGANYRVIDEETVELWALGGAPDNVSPANDS